MSQNRGPYVNIAIWTCLVVSGFAVFSKIITKLVRHKGRFGLKNLQLDDGLLSLALLLAASQTIVVSQQAGIELGMEVSSMSKDEQNKYEKFKYVSQILYLLTLSAEKAAAFLFALHLQPAPNYKMLLKVGFSLSALWTLTSTLAAIFQCKAPDVWRVTSGQCFHQAGFWAAVESVNIFIDVELGFVLCAIVAILQMSRTKYVLMIIFATRFVIILPITFRLIYIFRSKRQQSVDVETNLAVVTAIVMNTSIIITCIPFLKVLMEALQPGWSTIDVRKGVGFTVAYGKTVSSSNQFPSGEVITSKRQRAMEKKSQEDTNLSAVDSVVLPMKRGDMDYTSKAVEYEIAYIRGKDAMNNVWGYD